VLFAAYRIGSRTLKNGLLWLISATAFLAIAVLHIPFPIIVMMAGLIGYIGGKIAPSKFSGSSTEHASGKNYGIALIDDDTPTPDHARFTRSHMLVVLQLSLGIWLAAMLCLMATWGWNATLTQMSWFFTKAALLTFGGAYAVLPYVNQGAVEHYHWLTSAQMMDGLALGETTPGPLIMVVTFVGFVGGWTQAPLGVDSPFLSGLVAASLATCFTFLPSFVFIFLGGPLVETTHGNLKFTAPLTAITVAIVGIILNLALYFGYRVFWPSGAGGQLDGASLLIALFALVALSRYKINAAHVIAACGMAGLGYHFLA
jgi:chromate transporter